MYLFNYCIVPRNLKIFFSSELFRDHCYVDFLDDVGTRVCGIFGSICFACVGYIYLDACMLDLMVEESAASGVDRILDWV